ncbi:UNVERIFIED_CONTAM: hypothetical protein FKN15_014084 [Acipenser sinensis]
MGGRRGKMGGKKRSWRKQQQQLDQVCLTCLRGEEWCFKVGEVSHVSPDCYHTPTQEEEVEPGLQPQEEVGWEALLHSMGVQYCCCICGEWGHFPANCPLPPEERLLCPPPLQSQREDPERPAPEWEEPERPAPEWEEPERPQPKKGESVRPQPKRGESVHPQPKRGESVRPQPKRGKAEHPQSRYPPAEGEFLLVLPPLPWEDCVSLPPLPAEGEYLLVPPPPAEGEFLLVPPPPPWKDDLPLPPPPAEEEYLLVPPPSPWEDCGSLPPPPVEVEYLLVPPPSPQPAEEACLLVSPLQPEGEESLPISQPEWGEPLPPSQPEGEAPCRLRSQKGRSPYRLRQEQSSRSCLCLHHHHHPRERSRSCLSLQDRTDRDKMLAGRSRPCIGTAFNCSTCLVMFQASTPSDSTQHQVRWTDEEIRSLLQIIADLGVMDELDRSRQRHATIFTSITGALAELVGLNPVAAEAADPGASSDAPEVQKDVPSLIARTAGRWDRQYSHLLERLDHADQQHQEVVALHAEFLRTITRELQMPAPAPYEVGTRSALRSPVESVVREVCTEQYPLTSAVHRCTDMYW